jgi:hypothetical protein
LTLISSSPSSSPVREVSRLDISGLTSSSISTKSGEAERSATETDRVLDLDLELGATLFLLLGVVDGSMAGGGVGALNENSFSLNQ